MSKKAIDKWIQPLLGNPCWGLNYERQLNLSMNFGKPSLDVREPYSTDSKLKAIQKMASRRRVAVRGEWWLWIWCSYWQLTSGDLQLANGSSSPRRIEQALAQLAGQELVSVAVKPVTGATRFVFDLGGVLQCRRFQRNTTSELWMLYKPSRYVLSVYGDGTFSHHRSSEAGRRLPIKDD